MNPDLQAKVSGKDAKAQSEQLHFCFDTAEVCSVCATNMMEALRFLR